jgi:transcriptional regulator with XRE-family HTH domain
MKDNTNFDVKQIGARLKEVRKSLRKTLAEIGLLTGLSARGISEIENGKKKPSSIYLYAQRISI